MPNTVRAAAEGLPDYPHNPPRSGFFRELRMRWDSRWVTEPPDQNPDQESFMNQHVDRRSLLASAASIPAIGAATIATADTCPAAELADLIADYRMAREAFNAALDAEEAAEHDYFVIQPKREYVIPLAIGGGVSFYVDSDLDRYAEQTRAEIVKAYERKRELLAGLKTPIPEKAIGNALRGLRRWEKADLAKVDTAHALAQANMDDHGYGQALRNRDEASDAERQALYDVLAYCCTAAEEWTLKGRFLLEYCMDTMMDEQDAEVLFQSMIAEG